MTHERFGELHCHFDFSNTHLTDCINKLVPTIDYAVKSLHLKGLAVTDHECLSGHIKALTYMREIHKEYPDFQLVLGNEIYLCHDTQQLENGSYDIPSGTFYHFILLAKDAIGHRQLRELSSRAWSRLYTSGRQERLPTFYSDLDEIVKPNSGHLIASTACLGGEFPKLVLSDNVQGAESFASQCVDWFGKENFFIELQPALAEEQILFNKRAIKFCQYYGYRWIITNDCHYLTADKRTLHENYLKSHEEEREAGDFYESTYFKTCDEMLSRMDYLESEIIETGFKNTLVILNMCKDAGEYDLFHDTIVPQRKLPCEPVIKGTLSPWYDTCPSLKYIANSPYEQDRFYLQECEKGLERRNIQVDESVAKRIDVEVQQFIGISEKLGCRLTSYYNLMQRLEEIIWQVSIIGPGRGSACCLYGAYLLDITSVDSHKENLPYWRHTHVSKVSLPD